MCAQTGGMKCDASGVCVQCITAADCGSNTECQMFACSMGMCATVNTTVNTQVTNQVAGDCKKAVCNGNGGTTSITDDTDKPVDNNVCTDDVCTAGVPSNPIVTDRSCNGTEFCKSDGTCHQCNTDAQCGSANDTFCLKHTCVNNSCTIASSPTAGTLLPMPNQALHDCIDQVF